MNEPERLSIKETASLLGVAPSKLRYWEREGLITSGRDRSNNYRTFSLHELLEVSDVLFYRNLGVPLETLKGYRDLSLGELEEILGETQDSLEAKIAELQETHARLVAQRGYFRIGRMLLESGLRESEPGFTSITPIDYGSREQLEYLVRDQQSFGIIIDAASPEALRETCVDYPGGAAKAAEAAEDAGHPQTPGEESPPVFLECIAIVDFETEETNAADLFEQARALGYAPIRIIGRFLANANDGALVDYYHAWIECEDRPKEQ